MLDVEFTFRVLRVFVAQNQDMLDGSGPTRGRPANAAGPASRS